jgi:hypothetical protein
MSDLATQYDDALTAGGRIQIWLSIAASGVATLAGALAVVYFQFFYQRYESNTTIKAIECAPQQRTRCENGGAECTTTTVHRCELTAEGFEGRPLVTTYEGGGRSPAVGDPVTVYFDPKDKAASATLEEPMPRTTARNLSLVFFVLSAIALALLLRFRHNKTLQRIQGLRLARHLIVD